MKPWSRSAWALAFAGTLVLLIGVVLPPFVGPGLRVPLMTGFHTLCHQLPDRSFHADGIQLAVCHRCTGIYLGLVFGVTLVPLLGFRAPSGARWEGAVLLVAILPAALDWGGDVFGLWTNTVVTRVGTGAWFGLLAGYVLAHAVAKRPAERRRTVAAK